MTHHGDVLSGAEYRAFLDLSVRLGRDPLQVQGPGGNTSIKDGRTMWIKASGTWLAEAGTRDIMVPVDGRGMAAALAAGDPVAQDPANFVDHARNPAGLRGSIETSLHAAVSWPVVLHTHCVATIAIAVRRDAEALVDDRLKDLDAIFVPYTRPGHDLAREVQTRSGPETRVVVLGNHGLVVGGESVAQAEHLLREVNSRLEPAVTDCITPIDGAFERRLEGTGWMPAPCSVTQALAHDPVRRHIACSGTLYPDHLIFLGPGIAVGHPGEVSPGCPSDVAHRLVVYPGAGTAIPADATGAECAMARCLGDVVARIDPDATLVTLSAAEENALLDWAPEKHRQGLNAARMET